MGLQHKEALRMLCCGNGWSYGVLWGVKPSDPMLLMSEDAYHEEETGTLVEKMLHQVHLVGEGVIGQVAISGKHRWIFSDTYCGEPSQIGPYENQSVFQDTSEWHCQFLAGIKTIAIISVSPQIVVQFGSTQKILENLEFVEQAKCLFQQVQSVEGSFPYEKSQKAFSGETYDPCSTFASLLQSDIPISNYANIKFSDDNSCKELVAKAQCSTIPPQPPNPSTVGLHLGSLLPHGLAVPVIPGSTCAIKDSNEIVQKTTTCMSNSSFSLINCQRSDTDCQVQVLTPTPFMQMPQVVLQSNSSSTSSSTLSSPSTSTWSSNISSLTSIEEGLLCGMGSRSSPGIFPTHSDTNYPCRNMFPNGRGNSILNPLYNTSRTLDTIHSTEYKTGKRKLADTQHTSPLYHVSEGSPFLPQLPKESSTVDTFLGDFGPINATFDDSNPRSINNLSQWTAPPPMQVNKGLTTTLNDNLLQPSGVASSASGLVRVDAFSDISFRDLPRSFQNSTYCRTDTLWTVSNRKENSLNVPMQLPVDKDLFHSLQLDPRQDQIQEHWGSITLPVGSGNPSILSSCISVSASEFNAGSMTAPAKGFFPEVGLEQLFDVIISNANFVADNNSDDRLLTTTSTRTGNSNQVPLVGFSGISRSMDSVLSDSNSQKILHGSQKEMFSKPMVGSWIGGNYNMKNGNLGVSQAKRSEEPVKLEKKRARPGQSTRPRPKDRQQIQDRVKELREIVPNGTKCSIDALLDRTIKHMLFLESVAKYADKLKQIDESKMIGEESGVILKDSGGGMGTTWAFQLGGQTMVCPIVVEDTNPPGQMLVEMLCEECGCFLEIADIIRGFGLTILKGVMEVRDEKIWARFVVEANRDVTRMDIFLSLVQLLQKTAGNFSSGSQPNKVIDNNVPVFSDFQQSPMPLPISLA
ncbi:hypothetical protein MRB53_003220 [Persea americana]|uniref:Uncharacterized protein n=1 Tax=Persea americana TaxID=3435 RepID=A0ACC2MWP4_PERAE|nr:hypothetical protein MRB53_003220 [Persea americana]|eukprot:TRINITY_DN23754_c0_g1_i1.p1 TRINITY_DN23754_c0_g1~~TRINITY_DN23754_c0_g1_i1.p1  ORF type:complete len:917 (-),score=174.51 TRINITY_DN23754_c0_g1_i1:518-3268(-)